MTQPTIEKVTTVEVLSATGTRVQVTFQEYQIMYKAYTGRPNSPTYKVRPRPTANCDAKWKPEHCSWYRAGAGSANECIAATNNLHFPKSPEDANLAAECMHHS